MKNGKWYHHFLKNMIQQKIKSGKKPHKVKMAEPITVPSYQSYRKLEDVYKSRILKSKKVKSICMDLPRRFNNKLKNKRACNAFGNNL
jgi:hypothetical protein